MPPRVPSGPIVTAAARRARRIVDSDSPGSSPGDSRANSAHPAGGDDDDAEGEEDDLEDEEGAEDDGQGEDEDEDEDLEDEEDDDDAEGEADDDDGDFVDEGYDARAAQAPPARRQAEPGQVKIKFRINPTATSTPSSGSTSARASARPVPPLAESTGRQPRAAAQKSKGRSKQVAMDEDVPSDTDELMLASEDPLPEDEGDAEEDAEGENEDDGEGEEEAEEEGPGDDGEGDDDEDDEDEDGSTRDVSPSKMTARQRAKGNQDLQETLLALPLDPGNKKLQLTEAEKLQRREEMVRKRKRQSEQKLQDEQEHTINRLLRAQTTRSRNKLDTTPSNGDDGTGANGPSSRYASPRRQLLPENSIRWVSSVDGDSVVLRLAAPKGKEGWVSVGGGEVKPRVGGPVAVCAVDGCGERRKYRCVGKFEVGGCSMAHLKMVEQGLT